MVDIVDKIKVTSERIHELREDMAKPCESLFEAFENMTDIMAGLEEFLVCSVTGDMLIRNATLKEQGAISIDFLRQKISALEEIALVYEVSEKENIDNATGTG